MKRSTISTLLLACVCTLFSYAQPGSLDIHFGDRGILYPGNEDIQTFIVQDNGKITTVQNTQQGIIRRYLEDGNLDTSFGSGGSSYIDLRGDATEVTSVRQQNNGGYIVVGYIEEEGGNKSGFMQRLNPNGIWDSAFLDGGLFFDEIEKNGFLFYGLTVLDNDKILALIGNEDHNAFSFIRMLPNGVFDTSFGNGGVVHLDIGNTQNFRVHGISFLEAGHKIVIRGYLGNSNPLRYVLCVYKLDGDKVKVLYGPSHDLSEYFGWHPYDIGVIRTLKDGSMIILLREETAYTFVKLDPGGRLDESFGDEGKRLIPIDVDKWISTFEIHGSGNIFITGITTLSEGTDEQVAYIAQLDEYGNLVTAFGEEGFSYFNFHFDELNWLGNISLLGLRLQSNGKIYMLGRQLWTLGEYFIKNERIARFNPGILPARDEIVKDAFVAIIYPNPAMGSVQLLYKLGYAQNISISLFDNTGRILQSIINNEWQQEGEHRHVIDVSGLPVGAYRLHCKLGNQIELLSFVVN